MTKDWIGQSCAPWTTPAQASPRIGRLGNRLFRTGGLIALALLFGCGGGSGASTPVPTSGPAATPTPTPTLTSVEFSRQLSPGWNLGNSLDAIGGGTGPHATSQETAWGNPTATQALFDSVKAAGFNSVRIPVSWAQYADLNNTISIFWLDRVAQVVDYARNAGLYVIINVHWDGGWLQPTYAAQTNANVKLAKFWTQIATRFKDYDNHLLFAGTNEIAVENVYTAPTAENCDVQKSFNQKFVDAVRAVGGNNAKRYLVVQGYNTNIDHTISCNATLPADPATDGLMMEVHYYDPYDFALNANSATWQWGSIATDPSATDSWGAESYADGQFQKMKTSFIDKGIPVILGEYGAITRTEYDVPGTYRNYWDQYVTKSASQRGLVPVYWDNGYTSNHQMGLFNRADATQAYPTTINAIVTAAQ